MEWKEFHFIAIHYKKNGDRIFKRIFSYVHKTSIARSLGLRLKTKKEMLFIYDVRVCLEIFNPVKYKISLSLIKHIEQIRFIK